jgi:hypothetical protein
LLSALLLQVFYGIRSERQLMEQLDYNLLYRWFAGLAPDDPVWDTTTFTKNRDRLQNGAVFQKFMTKLLNHPKVKPLLSDEHFSVAGTLIEAWASQKSFRAKDGGDNEGDGADFRGQKGFVISGRPQLARVFMSVCAIRLGAVICPAFMRGSYGRWP